MLRELRRKVKTLIKKALKKPKNKPYNNNNNNNNKLSQPEEPRKTTMSHHQNAPFLFPKAQSAVLPNPSDFFAQNHLLNPKPTNSFFQNFVLKNGDQPEYIHPYLIKSAGSSLSLSYPSRFATSAFIYQTFTADLVLSASEPHPQTTPKNHVVSSFDDLSVTLDIPSANLRAFLVRGSPFLTCSVSSGNPTVSTVHAILSVSPNASLTKHTVKLNNNQTWLIYSSSPIEFSQVNLSKLVSANGFSGILRFVVLPDPDPKTESILDRFSSCYPVSGEASFTKPFCLEYKWDKKGWGDLLMLAHPLHVKLISNDDCGVVVLKDFKYNSIDGELVGIVGDTWSIKPEAVPITWCSTKGLREDSHAEIIAALRSDVEGLNPAGIATSSSYFYGKLVARAARLALIAEEVQFAEAVPRVGMFLKETIEPWLDGSFEPNGFLFDEKWGGIVTKQGLVDSSADFGFGIYNDHHYHLGYFLYAIAVLAKIDPSWGRKYRAKALSLAADFMTTGRHSHVYPRLRCFDLYKLHSWAGGLTEFADGRNQESTSEAVHAYYSAALLGLAYGDPHLVLIGSALASLEIAAAREWWHVTEGKGMYESDFERENRVVGVLWANKRDSGLWFAPPEWRECRLGIQVLPLVPITEALLADAGFARRLAEWAEPSLRREGVGEGWKGFVYAVEGVYDWESALRKIRGLRGFDDGNSLSNLLWWVHSRGVGGYSDGCFGFAHYSR